MSKIISANKLNRLWVNGVKPTVEKVKNTIKNRNDLMNNTEEGKLVDALAVKEAIKMVSENDLSSTPFKTDMLDVDLLNPDSDKNKPHRIDNIDASTLINSPITTGTFRGKWECIYHTNTTTSSTLMVKITEFWPVDGRVWVNHLNWGAGWCGWHSQHDTVFENDISSAPLKTNLLAVDLRNPHSAGNKVHKIETADASTLTSSPVTTGAFIGKWECIFYQAAPSDAISPARLMVKITEFYPYAGRIWYNHYNTDNWGGWFSDCALLNGTLSYKPKKTDMLDVDLAEPSSTKNIIHRIEISDATTLINSPVTSGTFIGKWECEYHTKYSETSHRVMVKITEFHPCWGRVWTNHYNYNKWMGWHNNGVGMMLDAASSIKANTKSGMPIGALGVKELYTELKDGLDIASSYRRAFGEIGGHELLEVYGTVCCHLISSNKCDIHISCKIIKNNAVTGNSTSSILSLSKISDKRESNSSLVTFVLSGLCHIISR